MLMAGIVEEEMEWRFGGVPYADSCYYYGSTPDDDDAAAARTTAFFDGASGWLGM